MSVQTLTPTSLKQQIHEVIEQLPEEQLPNLLHISETLLNGNRVNGVNGTVDNQPPLSNQAPKTEHPWMKFAGMFEHDPDWDEFQEAIAEYRRQVDAENEVI